MPQQGPDVGPRQGSRLQGRFLLAPCLKPGTVFSVSLLLSAPTPLASLGPWFVASGAQERVRALTSRLVATQVGSTARASQTTASMCTDRPHSKPQAQRYALG